MVNNDSPYRQITMVDDMVDILLDLKHLETVAAKEKFKIKPELISHISSNFDQMPNEKQIEVLKIMGTTKC